MLKTEANTTSEKKLPHRQEIELEYKGHKVSISPTVSRQGNTFVPYWKVAWKRKQNSVVGFRKRDFALQPFPSVRAAMLYSKEKIDQSIAKGIELTNANRE